MNPGGYGFDIEFDGTGPTGGRYYRIPARSGQNPYTSIGNVWGATPNKEYRYTIKCFLPSGEFIQIDPRFIIV